ncbi:MAG: PfkB family carbohydrate kinase [Ignavibacteria bacterium]|nr:PfkB family carbohydrate kinase [Ignavibacteria bacterium]
MILVVTLNPLLELRFKTSSFVHGTSNRPLPYTYTAGGKGINVSRQLKQLGLKSFNLSFAGPYHGKKYRECLELEQLDCAFVRTKDDTRVASVIVDSEKREVTSFFSADSLISAEEAQEFKSKLDKMIRNCEFVIFAGSSPSTSTDDIFPYGIKLAHEYDKVSVLDTYGKHLAACLDAAPTIVHNNIEETEKSLGCSLKSEEECAAYLAGLYAKGIKQAFLTNGSEPFYAANHDFLFHVSFPKVEQFDSTGSGDAFTAGLVYALYHDQIFKHMLQLAVSLGAGNAQHEEVCTVTMDEIEKIREQVTIVQTGKQLQLVDFTPTI